MPKPHPKAVKRGAPDKRVLAMLRRRVTSKWPESNVVVLWVWDGGREYLHYRWSPKQSIHRRVTKLSADECQIRCAMEYEGLVTAIKKLDGVKT